MIRYVDPSLPLSQRELIIHCSRYQTPAIIKYRSWKARKGPYRCRSCAMKKAGRKISKGMKRHWDEISSQGEFLTARKPHSEETRQKISESMKAHFKDPSNKVLRSIASKRNADAKSNAISEAMREKWKDPAYRQAVTEGNCKNADDLWGFKVSLKKQLRKASGS